MDDTSAKKDTESAKEMDYHQRNSILRGLWDIRDEDVFVLADLDEILSTETMRALRDCDVPPYLNMKMAWHVFNFACRYHHLETDLKTVQPFWKNGPHVVRGFVTKQIRPIRLIRNGMDSREKWKVVETSNADGWHLSYFMSVEQIRLKMKSFSNPDIAWHAPNMDPTHIRECMRECRQLEMRPTLRTALQSTVKHEALIPLSGLPWLVQQFTEYYNVFLH